MPPMWCERTLGKLIWSCQGHEKTQVSEVTAVNTNNYEEDEEEEDGDNLNFELCVAMWKT